MVSVERHRVNVHENDGDATNSDQYDFIGGISNRFTFLRMFGGSIARLKVTDNVRNMKYVRSYVNKYCINAVADLEFEVYLSWHVDGGLIEMTYTCDRVNINILQAIPAEIKCLTLRCARDYIDTTPETFVTNSIRKFEIVSENYKVFAGNPSRIDFNQLDVLKIVGFQYLSDEWCKFILKNKNLKRLSLCPSPYHESIQINKRLLQELMECCETLEVDARLIKMNEFNSLVAHSGKLMELLVYWDTNFIFNNVVPEGWTNYNGPYRAAIIKNHN